MKNSLRFPFSFNRAFLALKNNRKIFALALALFTVVGMAKAQTTLNMKDGTTTVSSTINFYDSYGPAVGATNYWNSYYKSNEEFVHTFKPGSTGYKVQVTFKSVEVFGPDPDHPDAATGISLGNWSVRLNDDFLYVYDGERVDDTKLIAAYTGNSENPFTIVATGSTGALTFVFKSNGRYNEEGWAAEVTQVATPTAQAPFIRRATCENEIEMLPTTLKAKIYYTIDGSTPSTSSTQYRRPFDFPAGSLTVKAISVLSTGSEASTVSTVTFADSEHLTNPAAPTVSDLVNNQVTMTAPAVPQGLNETYVVRYTMTTDGSTPAAPSLYNSTEYIGPITITTPGTQIKARTFAKSCDNWYSTVVAKTFSSLKCPKPTITLDETEQTITFDGSYNLRYTTDGTNPTASTGTLMNGTVANGTQTVTLSGLAMGTTVKAITLKDGYTASDMAIGFYSAGTTTTNSMVFLDDREDHSWSYYSDKDQPIHSLKPADIKITYNGNGTGTVSSTTTATPADDSWTGNATGTMVGVNAGESQNTFVYLKTLENAKEDGTGNYPYTMIANPFQVRPIYRASSGKGTSSSAPIINMAPVAPEPQTTPAPLPEAPILPEETEYFADRGNRSGTFTENFESTNVNNLPAGWEGSKTGALSEAPYVKSGTDLGSESRYLRFRSDAFNAIGLIVVDGESMAVMPYYANIESISFTYKLSNTSCTFYVGWYDGSNYQNGGQISLTSRTPVTVTLNSSNAAQLLNNVNSGDGRRIAFRLVSSSITERYLYLDDVSVTFTPKAPAFNYADGDTITGTSVPVTITRKDPSTVTYYKVCAADDTSTPSVASGSGWTQFPDDSENVTVSADKPRLKAFAYHVASGTMSAVTDATYNFTLRAPKFSHPGGTIPSLTLLDTIRGLDANTTVRYTTDGSDPATSSTASTFAGPGYVTVTMGEVGAQVRTQLRAIAVANNLATLKSAETSATYSFTLNPPTISPAGGVYFANSLTVTITGDGTIRYTDDGTDPTEHSDIITSGSTITISSTTTLKAKSFSTLGQSEVVEQTYTLVPDVNNTDEYRGFYAWRVKSKSARLKIRRANDTEVAVGGTINADDQIFFETDNEYGNEVEFEALWARAYVTTSTSTSSLNASVGVERNFMVLSSTPTPATSDVTIGSGSSTTNGQVVPLYWYNNQNPYSITQQIYTAAEIGAAGQISAIQFYVSTSRNNTRSLVIYMKQTSQNDFGSGSTHPMIPLSASDKVFTGTVNFNSTGWNTITLDTPFEYDGMSNIMVCVVDNTGSVNTSAKIEFRTYSTSQNRAWYNIYNSTPVPLFDAGSYFTNGNVTTYNNQIRFTKTVNLNGNEVSNLSVPCTVTSQYPNGKRETSTPTKVSGYLFCGADLKIESVEIAGANATLNANGHNLTIGRGVAGSSSQYVGTVVGTSGNKEDQTMDYTIRIESGWYKNFYLASNGNTTYSGTTTISARAVLGCDYDRANNDNSKLSIAPSALGGGNIYGGNGMSVTSSANKDNLTFDWYVKSGKFHDGILGAANGGDESIYLGSGQTNIYLQYIGKRRLTIEGGELASIAGGMNSGDATDGYNNNFTTGDVKDNVVIRMKGGNVRGAIYGAAAFAGAKGGRTLVFTSGRVNGWIAGGANGTRDTGGELYGSTFIYVGGNAKVVQTGANPFANPDDRRIGGDCYVGSDLVGINGAFGGNIFGAGCGIKPVDFDDNIDGITVDPGNPNITVGKVFGSTIVMADAAELGRDIYGGGKFGLVAGDASDGDYGLAGNTDKKARIYILGGTIHGDVMGGAQNQISQATEIYIRGGKLVGRKKNRPGSGILNSLEYYGDVYGGCDTWGTVNGNVKIEMTGGELNNIFGGGYGIGTNVSGDVNINISGGEIANNVYGGGESGFVTGNTNVTFSAGSVNEVFGAGLGTENATGSEDPWPPVANANITGNTTVTISGGTVRGSVYGGGENGSVNSAQTTNRLSKVTVSGGTVEGNVFGGGKNGVTFGNSIVTVSGGLVKLNVFGGALGSHGKVYFAGHKTVNILNGQIKGSVYGGSHDANDALTFNPTDFASNNDDATSSNINICGGQIEQHVYSAGYYGNTFGSVYTYIGLKAIEEAPNNNRNAMAAAGINFNKRKLIIKGHVWAGGDWGTFSGGTFGAPTITGHSNVYIDGLGYQSNDNNTTQEYYMKLKGSVMGCGTSADAGKGDVHLFVRNFGDDLPNTGSDKDYSPFLASTEITSIQRWEKVRIENSHLQMVGQGRITSLDIAEKYSLFSISEELIIANGSSLVMNSPADSLYQLYSVRNLTNIYNTTPTYEAVNYGELGTPGSSTDNKIRINNGGFLKVRYKDGSGNGKFGELKGFFHLMGDAENGTDIYARPKQSKDTPNQIPTTYDNPLDGGFVSYVDEENTFTAGTLTSSTFANVSDAPGTAEGETGEQIPYENHVTSSKGDSQYFRIWRYGGISHRVDAVLNAIADDSDTHYKTVTVDVKLPGWRGEGNYYRFVRNGDAAENYYTLIDYGADVLTFNAANYQAVDGNVPYQYIDETHLESSEWMSFNGTETDGQHANDVTEGLNQIEDNPNLNFGLVIKPSSGMSGNKHIVCGEANNYLANQTFGCDDINVTPTLSFELTFSNNLRTTRTNDPIIIPMVQCFTDDEGEHILDTVNIVLTIATSTAINLGSEWKMYAIMDGSNTNTHEEAVLRVEIPKFEVEQSGKEAKFYLKKAEFTPRVALEHVNPIVVSNSISVAYNTHESNFDLNKFGLTLMPIKSTVSSDTWRFITTEELDAAPGSGEELPQSEFKIGENGGRSPVSLDLALYYNANYNIETYTGEKPIHMGTVVYTLEFDNFAAGDENHIGTSDIRVDIYRKGKPRSFYVDGVNGLDVMEEGRGGSPNYAAKSIRYLLNRSDFLPGDIIYVVNTVTTTKETTWDGSAFQNDVTIMRYPGNHQTSNATGAIQGFDNSAFTGTMVDVQGVLNLNGIIVDGNKGSVAAEAPMFNVEDGGQLSLGNATTLQNNNNTSGDGGAVHVAYGGTLRMNEDATITNNVSEQGAGVFMDGTMIVSDHVQVTGNKSSTESTALNSNVWLAPIANAGEKGRVIQVGTADNDGFGPLDSGALIGVHKEDWGHGDNGFMPIVSVESGTEENLDLPYQKPQTVIVPDQTNYTLQPYNNPDFLYWTGTWVTAVTSQPSEYSYNSSTNSVEVSTPGQLAWVISVVNGENGQTGNNQHSDLNVTLTKDIDMSANMWVPIGEGSTPYTGTFNGNGHTVTGIGSSLGKDDMGMFGSTNGANIENLVVHTSINSNSDNTGTVVGNMTGGTLSNVEGVGILSSTNNSYNSLGGLVGTTTNPTTGTTTVHSSFAVVSVEGTMNSVVGGLVGEHYGDLYNAYSNLVISDNNKADEIGGLVGYNNGTVENCYSIVSDLSFPAFAYENHRYIKYCYADTLSTSYVGSGSDPVGSGTYGYSSELEGGKYGYKNHDQYITATNNSYVTNGNLSYDETNHKGVLTGLLATLNKWVAGHSGYSSWTRTLGSPINGDYPVLLIQSSGVCLGSTDGRVIDYKTNLNDMIQDYNDAENGGSIYLYAANSEAINKNTDDDVRVYIDENVGVLQADNNVLNARVAVTFDNSSGNNLGGKNYDWHMFSTPLSDTPLGINYLTEVDDPQFNHEIGDDDIELRADGYFPTNTPFASFDFYAYDEPSCHWINLKRNTGDHWHQTTGESISYTNETNLTQGKGYMMAVDAPTMLMSDGVLTNDGFDKSVSYTPEMANVYDDKLKGVNLIGNPYQSYLNMPVFMTVNADNVDVDAYYVIDADAGKYLVHPNTGSTNPLYAPAYLHPHQGFLVSVKEPEGSTPRTVTFNNTMRSATGENDSYFRGEKVNYPLVNLICTDASGMRDMTTVEMNRPELGGARKLKKMRTGDASLYAHFADNGYQALFAPKGVREVPVRLDVASDGVYTITWSMYNGEFHYVHLIDNMTGADIDMLTNNEYRIEASTEDYSSRFRLIFDVTGDEAPEPVEGPTQFAFFDGNSWVVTGQGTLQLFDVNGRCLMSTNVEGAQSSVTLPNVAAGVYMFRLSNNQNTQVQKVVVK